MQKLRLGLYGALTVAGIGWPWLCIYKFIKETEALGLTDPIEIVNLFSAGVWANASAGFIAADLTLVLIASFIFYADYFLTTFMIGNGMVESANSGFMNHKPMYVII